MLPEVLAMVRKAIRAFLEQDIDLAHEVIRQDVLIDTQHKESKREVEEGIRAEPSNAGAGLHFFTISKALERAADRATSIAEEVVFLVNGRNIRHSGL